MPTVNQGDGDRARPAMAVHPTVGLPPACTFRRAHQPISRRKDEPGQWHFRYSFPVGESVVRPAGACRTGRRGDSRALKPPSGASVFRLRQRLLGPRSHAAGCCHCEDPSESPAAPSVVCPGAAREPQNREPQNREPRRRGRGIRRVAKVAKGPPRFKAGFGRRAKAFRRSVGFLAARGWLPGPES